MVEPTSRFSEIKIPLGEPVHGLSEVSGVLFSLNPLNNDYD